MSDLAVAVPAWPASPEPRRRRVLLVGGSLNQTTIVHAIARELRGVDCVFTPYYADGVLRWAAERGLLDFTILGGRPKAASEAFLRRQGVAIDPRGAGSGFDLVVPKNLRGVPMVLVQEGMTDPEDWRYRLVRSLGLPCYLANTSMTGLSDAYAAFCVASDGYRDLFVKKGARREKIEVTGIPNFDDCASYLRNDFPLRGYVLAATSCLRETLKPEDRRGFIRRALDHSDLDAVTLRRLAPVQNGGTSARNIARVCRRLLS